MLLLFLKVLQDGIDVVKGFIYFLSDLGSSQHHLPADEDEENNPRFDHPNNNKTVITGRYWYSFSPVDEAGEQFRLVAGELRVSEDETLQPDGELDVAGSDHVLDLEILKFCGKSQLLHDPRVLPGSQPGVLLRLCSSADHLT